MTLDEQLNGANPPKRIHAADVDLLGETRGSFMGPALLGSDGIVRLDWQRPDGSTLHYARWVDEDGHWFYPVEEVMRRASELG